MKRRFAKAAILTLLTLWLAGGAYQMNKPLPEGISVTAPLRPAHDVRFLADYTFVDEAGQRHTDQAIFDEVFRLIDQAQQLVVLDVFLLNDFAGRASGPLRPLSDQLTRVLVDNLRAKPGLRVILITDPFNTLYGGTGNSYLTKLEKAGADIIITDLARLRDPNPAWSVLWRVCCQWFGNSREGGWLPSPVGTPPVTLRSWLALLNFKANHRKTLVVDEGGGWTGLVTSGNPHNGSSAHSNVALRFSGQAALDLLQTELAVARFSSDIQELPQPAAANTAETPVSLQVITEAAIRDAVIKTLDQTSADDQIRLSMFYLSHREIIDALLRAHERGASLRVLLDPNKDAFGRKKGGIPNRQVAHELHEAGIPVRWMDTHGEQSHSKALLVKPVNDPATLILGSANFTRRNLDDFNLETDIRLLAPGDDELVQRATHWFDRQWLNEPGRRYSVSYEHYADDSITRYWLYRFMESTGLSTF